MMVESGANESEASNVTCFPVSARVGATVNEAEGPDGSMRRTSFCRSTYTSPDGPAATPM